jgi:hypothetical protein
LRRNNEKILAPGWGGAEDIALAGFSGPARSLCRQARFAIALHEDSCQFSNLQSNLGSFQQGVVRLRQMNSPDVAGCGRDSGHRFIARVRSV